MITNIYCIRNPNKNIIFIIVSIFFSISKLLKFGIANHSYVWEDFSMYQIIRNNEYYSADLFANKFVPVAGPILQYIFQYFYDIPFFHLLVGFAGWFIARNLGIELNVLGITALLVASTFFVSAVPSLPGGVGVYEAAMTHTLRLLGADPAAAFTFAIIMHALIFVPSTGIALLMLIRLGTGQILKRPIIHQSTSIDGAEKLTKTSSHSSHMQDR